MNENVKGVTFKIDWTCIQLCHGKYYTYNESWDVNFDWSCENECELPNPL